MIKIDVSAGYRRLEVGELRREGDEAWGYTSECWSPSILSLGAVRGESELIRRKVRIQSEGWRFLDAEEILKEGDEINAISNGSVVGWFPAKNGLCRLGRRVNELSSFMCRRRYPEQANVQPTAEPKPPWCACGIHRLRPGEDPYAGHRLFLVSRFGKETERLEFEASTGRLLPPKDSIEESCRVEIQHEDYV